MAAPKTKQPADSAPPEAPDGADAALLAADTSATTTAAAEAPAPAPGQPAVQQPPADPGIRLGIQDACMRLWSKNNKHRDGLAAFQSVETSAGRVYDTLDNYERRFHEWLKQPA